MEQSDGSVNVDGIVLDYESVNYRNSENCGYCKYFYSLCQCGYCPEGTCRLIDDEVYEYNVCDYYTYKYEEI